MIYDLTSALDVAIGVVFLLLTLSMIVSLANEVVAKIMSWRSENLKEGIGNLLSDPDSKALAGLVYKHPLIRALGRQRNVSEPANPSYIPAQRFAQTLTEVIRNSVAAAPGSLGATRDGVVLGRGGEDQNSFARTSGAGRGEVTRMGDAGFAIPDPGTAMKDARSLVASLPDGDARTSLLVLADRAEGELDAFERNVAEWFDDGMDRVSGWYKRKVQIWLFGIALVVVVTLNANVFEFAKGLHSQPQLTADVISMAEKYHGNANSGDSAPTDPTAKELLAAVNKLDVMAGLPLGWDVDKWSVSALWSKSTLWLIPGWIVTAMLASLGAPFWFNVLGQLLDIRGSGKPPLKPRREGSSSGNSAGGQAT